MGSDSTSSTGAKPHLSVMPNTLWMLAPHHRCSASSGAYERERQSTSAMPKLCPQAMR